MKTKFLMIMAAAASIFTGCSGDGDAPDNGPVRLRLTSGVQLEQTRAFTPSQSTSIKKGETVSVWVDDAAAGTALYKANQLVANENNGFTGGTDMFFPQTGNNIDIYAIHGPFGNALAAGSEFPAAGEEFGVSADQSEAGGKAYTNSDLLYACERNVARNGNPTVKQLTFYHMLSKLELAIKVGRGGSQLIDAKAVTLGDVTLNGKFTPEKEAKMDDRDKRAAMVTPAQTPQAGELVLGQQTCEDFAEASVFYNEAIVMPQDMIGKKLTFKLKDGGKLTYAIPAFDGTPGKAVFEGGKKYRYHITLNLTGLTVESTIAEWDPVGAVEGSAEMGS